MVLQNSLCSTNASLTMQDGVAVSKLLCHRLYDGSTRLVILESAALLKALS